MPNRKTIDEAKLDRIVADAAKAKREREAGYRERALGMYPWICGRCAREFTRANLHELTVHHRNHNHDDNPADGSNWELLSTYSPRQRTSAPARSRGRQPVRSGARRARDFETVRGAENPAQARLRWCTVGPVAASDRRGRRLARRISG